MIKHLKLALLAGGLAVSAVSVTAPAAAGPDPFMGELMMNGYNFCPRGTAALNGQLLPISQNTALFSLLGTTYGGDGRTTFALPDLRGRSFSGYGVNPPGRESRAMGQRGGSETATLTVSNLPSHSHQVVATGTDNDTSAPVNNRFGVSTAGQIYSTLAPSLTMHPNTISSTGSGQSFGIMQPFLVINYCIATQGTYPSRS